MPSIKFFPFGIVILLLAFISCNKAQQPDVNAVKATLNDFTGLGGCSWVIKLNNHDLLEPINLDEFSIELKEGKKIWIKYKPAENMASICMVGLMVEIEAIWER